MKLVSSFPYDVDGGGGKKSTMTCKKGPKPHIWNTLWLSVLGFHFVGWFLSLYSEALHPCGMVMHLLWVLQRKPGALVGKTGMELCLSAHLGLHIFPKLSYTGSKAARRARWHLLSPSRSSAVRACAGSICIIYIKPSELTSTLCWSPNVSWTFFKDSSHNFQKSHRVNRRQMYKHGVWVLWMHIPNPCPESKFLGMLSVCAETTPTALNDVCLLGRFVMSFPWGSVFHRWGTVIQSVYSLLQSWLGT